MQFNDRGTQLSQIANEALASGLTQAQTAKVLLRYSQAVQDETESED